MEDALIGDIRANLLNLPHVVTDFTKVPDLPKEVGRISSLEAPHRIFDAIIRDSEYNGTRFPYTEAGKAVVAANAKNATALFRHDPTSILFGSWDSTGVSGGLGEKYTRCVVSELVAVNVETGTRKGTKVDPLNISSGVGITRNEKDKLDWDVKGEAKAKGVLRPSEINHGSIPYPEESKADMNGGITCDYVQQATTISLPALRQLKFPMEGKQDTDAAAHAVLAAIALHAAALNVQKGWHLRSRCDLVLDDGQGLDWDLLGGAGGKMTLSVEATRKLLQEAILAAKKAGLPWEDKPLELVPSKPLATLVRESQKKQRESDAAAE